MASKEIVTSSAGALAITTGQNQWTDVQRAALAQLGIDETPAGDLSVFLHQCQRTGLDPFLGQIYMIGRVDRDLGRKKYTIQTGIDGFRIVAERRGEQYGGQEDPQWCGEDGVWRDVWPAQKPPTAARVGVIRTDWGRTVYGIAVFAEFAETKFNGELTKMWKTKPSHMIAKCAEAIAIRKAFPRDLSGVYIDEEMQAPVAATAEREYVPVPGKAAPEQRAEIDWDAELAARAGDVEKLKDLYKLAAGIYGSSNPHLAERIATAGQAAADATVVDAEVVDEPAATDTRPATGDQKTAIAASLHPHGVTDREARLAVVSLLHGEPIASTNNLTIADAGLVLDKIDEFTASGQMAATVAEAIRIWTPAATETETT